MSQALLKPFSPAYFRRVLRSRPIAYWPLWEASGAVADDLKDLGNGSYTGVTFHRPGVNILGNPGFETAGGGGIDTLGSWSESIPGGGGTIERDATPYSGSFAAKLTAGANGRVQAHQSPAVIPGQPYAYSLWARGDGVNQGTFYLWDSTNNLPIFGDIPVTAGASYVRYSGTFTAPAGCLSATLFLNSKNNAPGAITYYDDVEIYATASPNGIGDGRNAPFFDGTNDHVSIHSAALAAAFNPAEGSLMAWAKASGAGVWTDGVMRWVAALAVNGDNFVRLYKSDVNNTFVGSYNAATVLEQRSFALSTTAWFHACITWSKVADQVRVYLNGVQVGDTMTILGNWAGALDASLTRIGALNDAPNFVWSGLLAHAGLWNRALTPAEVAYLARVR